MALARHWFLLVSAIWLVAFGGYLFFYPQRVRSSFKSVSEKEKPAWSYMPTWYYRAMGLVVLALSALFAFLFARGR
jgi:hypothetical protein